MNSSKQTFLMVTVIVAVGAVVVFGIQRGMEDRAAQNLCRVWANTIIAEAKANPPEVGRYEAELPVTDFWGQPLTSVLVVEELANFAEVRSNGRDMIVSNDDYVSSDIDVHVRKSILKGIVVGSHSMGKGLTSGVIEGLGEAKHASLKKAKEGASKVKTSLMGRFKRKEAE